MSPVWRSTGSIALLIIILLAIGAPSAFADIVGIDKPIIPCGTDITNTPDGPVIANPCTICHIFELIQNIYNFLIIVITPPVAIFMVGLAGFYWLTSAGNPAGFSKGIQILKTTIIGLAMMYAAWLIVSFGINLIAQQVVQNGEVVYDPAIWYKPTSWFDLKCDI